MKEQREEDHFLDDLLRKTCSEEVPEELACGRLV